VLTNEVATEDGIEEQLLDWFRETATQDDIAVLMIAGHGVLDGHTYYFASHDMDPKKISSTCVRWSAFADLARDLHCPFIMFVDTCHSSAIVDAAGITPDPLLLLSRDDLGVVVYSSCQRGEMSRESGDLGHGVFTYALLKTFQDRESDLDQRPDGRLSISELERNLYVRVREITSERQTPVSYRPQGMPDIDLFVLPPE